MLLDLVYTSFFQETARLAAHEKQAALFLPSRRVMQEGFRAATPIERAMGTAPMARKDAEEALKKMRGLGSYVGAGAAGGGAVLGGLGALAPKDKESRGRTGLAGAGVGGLAGAMGHQMRAGNLAQQAFRSPGAAVTLAGLTGSVGAMGALGGMGLGPMILPAAVATNMTLSKGVDKLLRAIGR